jgi:multiple sugar transport system substrate-binding protein
MNESNVSPPINDETGWYTHNKWIYLLFSLAIFLSLLFYLFPFQSDWNVEEDVVKIYFADNITDAHLGIIKRFNELYRGKIEVIPVHLSDSKFNTNERKELITRTLRSRSNRVDVFALDQIWMPRFAKWAEPLSNFFTSEEIEQIISPALSTCMYKGKLYGIPFFIDVGVLYYRQDLISRLPGAAELEKKIREGITWDKLLEIRQKYFPFKPIYLFQGDAYEGLICNFLEILGGLTQSNESINLLNLDDERMPTATHFMIDLIYKHKIVPESVTEFNELETFHYALRHNVPFFRGWPPILKSVSVLPQDSSKLQSLKIAPLPHFSGNSSASTIGGWNLMIPRQSTVKKEAIIFIKYTMLEEAQRIIYETAGLLPILKSFYQDDSLRIIYPDLQYYKKLIENGVHRPAHPDYTRIADILSLNLNKALKKECSVSDALSRAQKEINKLVYE